MGFPMPGAGLGLTCAAVTSALPGPSSGAPAQWFGSGMENELTRGEQPACTSGGEAFYTVKQAMPLEIFFSFSWSAAWELAGRWQGRDSQLLTLAAPCPVTLKGSSSSPSL